MEINMVILERNFKHENRNVSNFFLCKCMCMVCTSLCVHTCVRVTFTCGG